MSFLGMVPVVQDVLGFAGQEVQGCFGRRTTVMVATITGWVCSSVTRRAAFVVLVYALLFGRSKHPTPGSRCSSNLQLSLRPFHLAYGLVPCTLFLPLSL